MTSPAEQARDQYKLFEQEEKLISKLNDANQAYEADPTDANYRRHLKAEVTLVEHRSAMSLRLTGGGMSVGGNAVRVDGTRVRDDGSSDAAGAGQDEGQTAQELQQQLGDQPQPAAPPQE